MRRLVPILTLLLCACVGPLGQPSVSGSGNPGTGPSLVRLDRAAFKPGDRLTLFGAGFDPDPSHDRVVFTGGEATAELATSESLVVRVPSEAQSGTLYVALGERASQELPYVVTPPEVVTLSTTATSAGATLVIQGRNFSPVLAENRVSFNGTFVTPASGGNGLLLVVVSGTTGPLTVQTGAGVSAPVNFVVIPQLGGNFNP